MSNFNASIYFGTPVWTNEIPEFIKPINKLADKLRKNAFAISSLSIEKASLLEKLFGRKIEEKERNRMGLRKQKKIPQ